MDINFFYYLSHFFILNLLKKKIRYIYELVLCDRKCRACSEHNQIPFWWNYLITIRWNLKSLFTLIQTNYFAILATIMEKRKIKRKGHHVMYSLRSKSISTWVLLFTPNSGPEFSPRKSKCTVWFGKRKWKTNKTKSNGVF